MWQYLGGGGGLFNPILSYFTNYFYGGLLGGKSEEKKRWVKDSVHPVGSFHGGLMGMLLLIQDLTSLLNFKGLSSERSSSGRRFQSFPPL